MPASPGPQPQPVQTPSTIIRQVADAIAPLADPCWVEGEVADLRAARHAVFFVLTDATARLQAVMPGRDATRIRSQLSLAGTPLRAGQLVRAHGHLTMRGSRGEVQFVVDQIDPHVTPGPRAAATQALATRLDDAGQLARNGGIPIHPAPLRLVVVGPTGQGVEDFLHRLKASPWAWQVRHLTISTAAPKAPGSVAGAITGAVKLHPDLIVITRGGGEAATEVFDAAPVVGAIAGSSIPVIVAVGHSTDRSLADRAAAVSCATPQAAAEWLVARLEYLDARICHAALANADAWQGHINRQRKAIDTAHAAVLDAAATATAHEPDRSSMTGPQPATRAQRCATTPTPAVKLSITHEQLARISVAVAVLAVLLAVLAIGGIL
ncbi:MAG: exodeoxyribonuclease VII large subunit [Acidimicrobiales bacterium]